MLFAKLKELNPNLLIPYLGFCEWPSISISPRMIIIACGQVLWGKSQNVLCVVPCAVNTLFCELCLNSAASGWCPK